MSSTDSVVLETSMGDVQLELYWEHAPKAISVGLGSLTCAGLTPGLEFVLQTTDMQEFCRASAKGLLQRHGLPQNHPGLYGPRW